MTKKPAVKTPKDCLAGCPELNIYFSLHRVGLDVERISKIIKLRPWRVWKKGENCTPHSTIKHKDNGWEYRLSAKKELFLDRVLKKLVTTLRKHEKQILKAIERTKPKVDVSICIYTTDELIPSLYIPKSCVKQFAKFNAEVDIDFYLVE